MFCKKKPSVFGRNKSYRHIPAQQKIKKQEKIVCFFIFVIFKVKNQLSLTPKLIGARDN